MTGTKLPRDEHGADDELTVTFGEALGDDGAAFQQARRAIDPDRGVEPVGKFSTQCSALGEMESHAPAGMSLTAQASTSFSSDFTETDKTWCLSLISPG